MNAFEAGLALLSTIVGGGIVGIPYAILQTGIPLGVALNFGVAIGGWYTGSLYLKVKDMSPTYVESLYELGFVTMGTSFIYFYSVLVILYGTGCTILYFIVFSNISASLAKAMLDEGTENMWTQRTIYVVCLAVLMAPLCLKKMLGEIKFLSILLFVSIAIFILLFIV